MTGTQHLCTKVLRGEPGLMCRRQHAVRCHALHIWLPVRIDLLTDQRAGFCAHARWSQMGTVRPNATSTSSGLSWHEHAKQMIMMHGVLPCSERRVPLPDKSVWQGASGQVSVKRTLCNVLLTQSWAHT